MLNFIAKAVLLIVMILFGILTLGTYLVIVGGNMNKTDEERILEDEEQMECLRKNK